MTEIRERLVDVAARVGPNDVLCVAIHDEWTDDQVGELCALLDSVGLSGRSVVVVGGVTLAVVPRDGDAR